MNQSRKSSVTQKDVQDLQRAYSTYLNVTGPGDYTLPSLVYGKSIQSNKKNSPMFTFQQKTKLPYFPQCYTVNILLNLIASGIPRQRCSSIHPLHTRYACNQENRASLHCWKVSQVSYTIVIGLIEESGVRISQTAKQSIVLYSTTPSLSKTQLKILTM